MTAGDVDPAGFRPGPTAQVTQYVPPPEKVRGKHRWIATAMHWLSRDSAAGLTNPREGDQVHLDLENLGYVAVGCIDCEQPFPAAEPCPAGDSWDTA